MSLLPDLERWRERQLDEYQRAQIIDRMDRQRLLDEYQRAEAIDRMDRQVTGISELARILSGVESDASVMQADLARLLAVADQALPAIVEQLALAAQQLGTVEQLLANPTETAAMEQFRRGSHALTSATQLATQDSSDLATDWLEEAISDLVRAVETYPYHFESWYLLGVALERRPPPMRWPGRRGTA
jgi:tetratricopeptide (TPR) repeat protein